MSDRARPNVPPSVRRRLETASSDHAHRVLDAQRAKHEGPDVDVDDEGIGAIVNNTGLDGDAPSG